MHTSLVALRQLQKRQMEPEYYSPDGVGAVVVVCAQCIRLLHVHALLCYTHWGHALAAWG